MPRNSPSPELPTSLFMTPPARRNTPVASPQDESLTAKIQATIAANKKTQELLQNLEKEHDVEELRNEKLSADNTSLEKENVSLQNEIDSLRKENDSLKKDIRDMAASRRADVENTVAQMVSEYFDREPRESELPTVIDDSDEERRRRRS